MIDTRKLPRPVTQGAWKCVVGGLTVYSPNGNIVCEFAGPNASAIAALPEWVAACDERDAEIARLRKGLGEIADATPFSLADDFPEDHARAILDGAE